MKGSLISGRSARQKRRRVISAAICHSVPEHTPRLRPRDQFLPGHFRHLIHRQVIIIRQLLIAFTSGRIDLFDQRQRFLVLTQRRQIAIQRFADPPLLPSLPSVSASADELRRPSANAAVNSRFLIATSE
jgi:hypothetical protein